MDRTNRRVSSRNDKNSSSYNLPFIGKEMVAFIKFNDLTDRIRWNDHELKIYTQRDSDTKTYDTHVETHRDFLFLLPFFYAHLWSSSSSSFWTRIIEDIYIYVYIYIDRFLSTHSFHSKTNKYQNWQSLLMIDGLTCR